MKDIPYKNWVNYIEQIFEKYNIRPNQILELGCGTGNISIPLAKKGYKVMGLDLSEDMLAVASQKAKEQNIEISFVQESMVEFSLHTKADVILAICDSLNYITDEQDLLEVFHRAYQHLEEEGFFIFDLNTLYKFSEVLAEHVFVEHLEGITYIWENYFDQDQNINEYHMTFFQRNKQGSYEKFEEYHEERGYSIEEVQVLLNYADFECMGIYDAFTFEQPRANSERIYVVAKKKNYNDL